MEENAKNMPGTSLPDTSRLTNEEALSHVSDTAPSARPTFRRLVVYIDNYYCFLISNEKKYLKGFIIVNRSRDRKSKK